MTSISSFFVAHQKARYVTCVGLGYWLSSSIGSGSILGFIASASATAISGYDVGFRVIGVTIASALVGRNLFLTCATTWLVYSTWNEMQNAAASRKKRQDDDTAKR